MLKLALSAIFLAVAMVTSQEDANMDLRVLVEHEVITLVTEGGLDTQQCTDRCDAIFKTVDAHDEELTDRMCARTCRLVLEGDMTGAGGDVTSSHHHNHHNHNKTTTATPTA